MATSIIIGVTGHRDLRNKDIPKLRQLVYSELNKIKTEYPHSPLTMLNSLASGADALCAEEALKLGIRLVCPLPMEAVEYRKDFEGEGLMRFKELLEKSAEVFVAPDTEISPAVPDRDFHYRQAGIYVATHSHVLLALWDGSHSQKGGCGTAEAVDFMLSGDFVSNNDFRTADNGAVLHISTPRMKNEKDIPISCSLIENKKGCLRETLTKIELSNISPEN